MLRTFLALVLGIASPIVGVSQQPENLILNGGFETPAVVNNNSYELARVGWGFDGWTVVGPRGAVALMGGGFGTAGVTFPPHSGKQWVDLTGEQNAATGITQRVPTVVGATYRLTYHVGNLFASNPSLGTTSTVDVLVDGNSVLRAENADGSGQTTLVWKAFTVDFKATRAATMLSFVNFDHPSDSVNGLDDVSLVRVAAGAAGAPRRAPAK
jgi:hypothetical protein